MKRILQEFWSERALLLPAFSASFALGYLPVVLLPWTFDALASSGGYSQIQSGWLVGAEIGALAMTSLFFAGSAARPNRRLIACVGIVVAMLADAAGVFTLSSALLFAATRIAAGVGFGLALAVGTGSVVDSRNPPRAFAFLWFLFALWELFAFNAVPFVLTRFGVAGILAFPAVVSACLLPVVLRVPAPIRRAAAAGTPPLHQPHRLHTASTLVLLTCFFFSLRDTLIYSFSEQLAVGIGLTTREFGALFGFGAVAALVGPLSADWLEARGKLPKAIAAAALLVLVTSATMMFTRSPALFEASAFLYPGLGMFMSTLLSATAVRVDGSGRTATMVSAVFCLCQALGAPVGGTLLHLGGLNALATAVLASGVLTLGLCMVSAISLTRVGGASREVPG